VIERCEENPKADGRTVHLHRSRLGACLLNREDYSGAQALIEPAYRALVEAKGSDHRYTIEARDRLDEFRKKMASVGEPLD
jgi:hypothetical protein